MVPALVVAVTEVIALPLARRHETPALADDVDSGGVAEAKSSQVFVHIVDAKLATDFVKIHVAGLGNGIVEVYGSVTLRFPVPISVLVALQLKVADADGLARQVGRTGLQGGQ